MKWQVLALAIAIVVIGAADPPRSVAQSDSQRAQRPAGVSGPPFLPDLVVQKFEPEGPRIVGDHVEVSVAIGVKNQGNAMAGNFKVEIQYTYPDPAAKGSQPRLPLDPYVVPFAGSNRTWGPLAPGQVGYYKGDLVFPPTVRRVIILLRAVADSCHGPVIVVPCPRVFESNETNNTSVQVSVSLP